VDSHSYKRVLVDNGLDINVISSILLERLKVPIKFLNTPTLTIRAFNNTLAMIMGIVILPVKVRVTKITMTCHLVEGEIEYNLYLGQNG